jgi:hypothetical protein
LAVIFATVCVEKENPLRKTSKVLESQKISNNLEKLEICNLGDVGNYECFGKILKVD